MTAEEIEQEYLKEKGYGYMNPTIRNEFSYWLMGKLIEHHKQQSKAKPLPSDEEIWEWWKTQSFQKDDGEQDYTMLFEIDLPKILKAFISNLSQPLEQSGGVGSKKQFYEYVESLGIKTNDAQRLMMLAKASEPSREDLLTEIMALRAMVASRDFDLKQLKEKVRPRIKLSDASDVKELTAYIHQLWSYCTILEDDMAQPSKTLPTDEEIVKESGRFIHKKTGHPYTLIHEASKMKDGSGWVESVVYQSVRGDLYTREKKDFYDKFKPID